MEQIGDVELISTGWHSVHVKSGSGNHYVVRAFKGGILASKGEVFVADQTGDVSVWYAVYTSSNGDLNEVIKEFASQLDDKILDEARMQCYASKKKSWR
jgi:hypothetical protein